MLRLVFAIYLIHCFVFQLNADVYNDILNGRISRSHNTATASIVTNYLNNRLQKRILNDVSLKGNKYVFVTPEQVRFKIPLKLTH